MAKSKWEKDESEKEVRERWDKVWIERESLLRNTFGETSPRGCVVSFSWSEPRLIIPGACALAFPPTKPRRTHWLYVTHGLTQPLNPSGIATPEHPSEYGWEFGVQTGSKVDWATDLLYEILSYWRETENRVDVGHRLPVAFYEERDGIRPLIRDLQEDDPYPPIGEIRALVFWPYLAPPSFLSTKTGYFGVLIGTTITARERELAKETSSAHLLLLLLKAGIGQVSRPNRACVTQKTSWAKEWESISKLTQEEAEELLTKKGK